MDYSSFLQYACNSLHMKCPIWEADKALFADEQGGTVFLLHGNIFEKWQMARQFIKDPKYATVRYYDIDLNTIPPVIENANGEFIVVEGPKLKNEADIAFTRPQDFFYLVADIDTNIFLFDSLPEEDCILLIMGIDPGTFRTKNLLSIMSDNISQALTGTSRARGEDLNSHFLYDIFQECFNFIKKLLDSSAACQEIPSFMVDDERQFKLKDVIAWATGKAIPVLPELQNALGPTETQPCTDNQHQSTPNLPLFEVKRNVASVSGPSRGRATRNENTVALQYIAYWQNDLKWTEIQIAEELYEKGAGNAVIGYLLSPESEDLSNLDNKAAAKRGRRNRGLS